MIGTQAVDPGINLFFRDNLPGGGGCESQVNQFRFPGDPPLPRRRRFRPVGGVAMQGVRDIHGGQDKPTAGELSREYRMTLRAIG